MSNREDRQLREWFDVLEPDAETVARIEQRVLELLGSHPATEQIVAALAAEWLSLLRTRPVESAALLAVAGFLLLITAPFLLLPLAFFA